MLFSPPRRIDFRPASYLDCSDFYTPRLLTACLSFPFTRWTHCRSSGISIYHLRFYHIAITTTHVLKTRHLSKNKVKMRSFILLAVTALLAFVSAIPITPAAPQLQKRAEQFRLEGLREVRHSLPTRQPNNSKRKPPKRTTQLTIPPVRHRPTPLRPDPRPLLLRPLPHPLKPPPLLPPTRALQRRRRTRRRGRCGPGLHGGAADAAQGGCGRVE